MPFPLDEIDYKILRYLQEHARDSNVQLADHVGLSPAPCLRRVRALEEAGVIRKYVALLDPSAVNLGVTVFVQISLDLQVEGRLEIFERAIMARPEGRELGAAGLKIMVMPRLPCMTEVRKSGLSFIGAAAGEPGPDGRPFDPVRRFMVRQWINRVQEEIANIGATEWMP